MLLDPRRVAERLLVDETVTADDLRQTDPESLIRELRAFHRRQLATATQPQHDQRYRAIVESAQDGVIVIDSESRIREFNPAAERIFGFRKEAAIGRSLEDLILLPEHRALHQQGLKRSVAGKADALLEMLATIPSGYQNRGQWRHLKRDGTPIDVEITAHDLTFDNRSACVVLARDVTQRKRVEAELLRNREQLRVASRLSRVGAWRVEIPAMTISWSEDMYAIFEVDPDREISLGEAFDFYEPQSREMIGEAFEACCRAGLAFDSELLILTAKGNDRWVRAIGEAVRDRNGDIRSVQGACQDISESRRTQARILELSTRLSDTLKKISDALITLDPEWNFTFINRRAEQLLHRDRQELLGKNIWEQFPEAVGSPFEIHYRRAMKDQVTVSFEQYFAPLKTWFMVRAYPTPDAIAVYFQDITEQKLAEAAAQEATERFRALAQATNDAIWDWNLTTNRVWWNEGFETLFGYRPEEIDATSDFWARCIHPDDREAVLASIHRARYSNAPYWSGEYRFRRLDGRYAFVLYRGYVIRDPQGTAMRMIGGMTDLTSIKRIEEELTRSNEDLQQFAYVASHDLQEPLRAVSGCVQLLKRRYGERLDAAADELISHTVDGVQRMRTLIHDLLEYSRLGTHDQPPRPTDLAEVLNTVLANLDHAIERSQAEVSCDPLPTVIADRGQMVLLFQNLIANAIKFRGQERPQIHIGAVAQKGNWRLSIKDNGIGIKSDYFDRIFVLFQRLHTRDEFSGTGIGLAMCKKIVDRHGGRIWVESRPGEGSCFFFTIPDYEE